MSHLINQTHHNYLRCRLIIFSTTQLFFFGLLCATPSASWAETYFVAQQAAGSGDGTSYENRASLSTHNAGFGVFADLVGDTVVLTGVITGSINVPSSGEEGQWVVYTGDDGTCPPASIEFLERNGWSIINKDYVELKNLHFTNISYSSHGGRMLRVEDGCDYVRIHDCVFHLPEERERSPFNTIWIYHHGSNIEIDHNEVIANSTFDSIVLRQDTLSGDLVDISIHHNRLVGCRHNIVYMDNGWPPPENATSTIRRVRIHHNEMSAPDNGGCRAWSVQSDTPDGIAPAVEDVEVHSNYIHDVRHSSQIKKAIDVRVYNNLFVAHFDRCISSGVSCAGDDPACIRPDPGGCWWGTSAITVYNEYTPVSGPFYIYNNTFYNLSRGAISVSNGHSNDLSYGLHIWNNLIIETDTAPNVDYEGMPRGDGAPIRFGRRDGDSMAVCFPETLTIENNIVFNHDGVFPVRMCDTLLSIDELNEQPFALGNFSSDPLFVEEGLDFNLEEASPACDQGRSVGLDEDFAGNPRDGMPDIGAYEYVGATDACEAADYSCCDRCVAGGTRPELDYSCAGLLCCVVCEADHGDAGPGDSGAADAGDDSLSSGDGCSCSAPREYGDRGTGLVVILLLIFLVRWCRMRMGPATGR